MTVDETGRVAQLLSVLKSEIQRLLDKWAPQTDASDGQNDHDVVAAPIEVKKDQDRRMQEEDDGVAHQTIRDFNVEQVQE